MSSLPTPEEAVDFIIKHSVDYAKAKADRTYLQDFRKSKKALLSSEKEKGTISAKDDYAYAHEDYIALLQSIRVAVEEEEMWRHKIKAMELAVGIWQTNSANSRAERLATKGMV